MHTFSLSSEYIRMGKCKSLLFTLFTFVPLLLMVGTHLDGSSLLMLVT